MEKIAAGAPHSRLAADRVLRAIVTLRFLCNHAARLMEHFTAAGGTALRWRLGDNREAAMRFRVPEEPFEFQITEVD